MLVQANSCSLGYKWEAILSQSEMIKRSQVVTYLCHASVETLKHVAGLVVKSHVLFKRNLLLDVNLLQLW